jgi:predicted Zn-dependent protease with MMP-like domain
LAYVAAMVKADPTALFAPDAAALESLAQAVIARLPETFSRHLDGVRLIVEDFASDTVLREMGVEDAFELTGLYNGRPVGQLPETGEFPSTIHLYRRPLLDEWVETGVALDALVAHVVIHEIGHHFGLFDADMHALEELAAHEDAES